MGDREYKPSTRVGYRNRPRTLPAKTIIQEFFDKDEPDWDYPGCHNDCCDECYYGPMPAFEVGDSVTFRIPGAFADVLKPGDGWATGEVIAKNVNDRGYVDSYTVFSDQPVRCYRRDTFDLNPHKIQLVDPLERLARL